MSRSVWVVDNGGSGITELNSSLTPVAAAHTGGGLSAPNSIAIDSVDNVWITDTGNGTVTEASPPPD